MSISLNNVNSEVVRAHKRIDDISNLSKFKETILWDGRQESGNISKIMLTQNIYDFDFIIYCGDYWSRNYHVNTWTPVSVLKWYRDKKLYNSGWIPIASSTGFQIYANIDDNGRGLNLKIVDATAIMRIIGVKVV